jgi:hypothetical protein
MDDATRIADLPGDRRRLLTLHVRASALLALGRDRIDALEKVIRETEGAPAKVAERQEFVRLLALTRRMAAKQWVYEDVDGVACVRRPPTMTSDDRLAALTRLAVILRVPETALDAETGRHADELDRVLDLVETYMAKLPKAGPRRSMPDPRPRPKRLVLVDAALRTVAAALPDAPMRKAEREQMQQLLLGDLDDHVAKVDESAAPATINTPVRRAAMLRATCDIFDEVDRRRRDAVKRKSGILMREFPKGSGDGLAYEARRTELEDELLQPLHETLDRFRGLAIRFAVNVAPVHTWPAGNSQADRALAFGRTVDVGADDLAAARASLGYGRVDAEPRAQVVR